MAFEYKVVPAPQKGLKAKGVRSGEERFSLALETLMNDLAADGWEYQRAETLPSVERSGLTGSSTEWRNVLVFRRAQKTHDANDLQQDTEVTKALPAPSAGRVEPELTAPASSTQERRLELINSHEKTGD